MWNLIFIILLIISIVIWQIFIVVYESKIIVLPIKEVINCGDTLKIEVISLNSLGKKAFLRSAEADIKIVAQGINANCIPDNYKSGLYKLAINAGSGEMILKIKPRLSLLESVYNFKVEKENNY